jgi:hypothetical protein
MQVKKIRIFKKSPAVSATFSKIVSKILKFLLISQQN